MFPNFSQGYYQVKPEDDLTSISKLTGMSLADLVGLNGKTLPPSGSYIRTVYNALTPEQQSQLTGPASNVLAKTPYGTDLMSGGGQYTQLIPGTTGRVQINPAVANKPWLNLHEGLHAIDTNLGNLSQDMQFSQDTRRQLVNRYYSSFENGYRGGNFGNESHIPQREAFAAGGQLGPGGIPAGMAKYYSGVFVGQSGLFGEGAASGGYGAPPVGRGMIQGQGGYTAARAGISKQADITSSSFAAFNEQYRLTGKYNDAVLPQAMTLDVVKQLDSKGFFSSAVDASGNPLSPAMALAAYGYTFQNGAFVKTGAPGSAQTGKPGPGQAGYNPSGNSGGWTLVRNARGKLVWQRPGANRGGGGPAPEAATNAGATPSTVLGIQLQGG